MYDSPAVGNRECELDALLEKENYASVVSSKLNSQKNQMLCWLFYESMQRFGFQQNVLDILI